MWTSAVIIYTILTSTLSGSSDSSNNVNGNLIDDIFIRDLQSDEFLDSMGFLKKYGYPAEKLAVTTGDGYTITMIRIPKKGPPVLLVHGISDSSDEWLVLGPERSLAYQLSDKGFDVWLFNHRGNRYSKGHKRNIPNKQYWDFSYDEMATQDLPVVIDHILNVTSQEKLSYIGFSQGTTLFLVMCSMKPEYNNKIQVPILLAPIAWLSNLKMPIVNIASANTKLFELFTNGIGLYELFPFNANKAFHTINCHRKYPTAVCNIEYHINFGLLNSSYMSPDKITVIDSHVPAGVAAKNLMHYIQGFMSKKFRRFDYGIKKNLEVYSSEFPPSYNVKLVTVPVNMISSEADWLSHYKDVQTLKGKLPNIKRFIVFNSSLEFSHLEFVYGTRVQSLVNEPVISILLDELNMR